MRCANCGCEFDLEEAMNAEYEHAMDIWDYKDFVDMSEPICEECAFEYLTCIIKDY